MSKKDSFYIKKMNGICPQEDVLYDLLNSYEHLELYAMLKGLSTKTQEIKVNLKMTCNKINFLINNFFQLDHRITQKGRFARYTNNFVHEFKQYSEKKIVYCNRINRRSQS
jgi:hypothetical protein